MPLFVAVVTFTCVLMIICIVMFLFSYVFVFMCACMFTCMFLSLFVLLFRCPVQLFCSFYMSVAVYIPASNAVSVSVSFYVYL